MSTKEISREQWISFFNRFSQSHQSWVATVEVLGRDLGDQEESSGLPLVGISADTKDKENRIEITLGGRPDATVTRIINNPKRLWLKDGDAEGHEAIEIESDDQTKTLITFRMIPSEQSERQLPRQASR